MAPPKKARRKVRRTVTLDHDVDAAVSETASAQRSNPSALINYTLAERFLGAQDRDMAEGGETEPQPTTEE